jgi:ADP-ribose pyrophosphatase YjhB (NUDIX family)
METDIETEPVWLSVVRELMGIAQTGLAFTSDRFDRERYMRLQALAAELLAVQTGIPAAQVLSLFTGDSGYATPKIGVRGAVFDGNRILMVKETSDGRWSLPGGWCDLNQTAAECTEREILEESGLIAKAVKLAGVYDYRFHNYPAHAHHHYILFFVCELVGGEMATSNETDAVGWFGENELPDMSTSRATPAQVHAMFRHYRDPALATEFDRPG